MTTEKSYTFTYQNNWILALTAVLCCIAGLIFLLLLAHLPFLYDIMGERGRKIFAAAILTLCAGVGQFLGSKRATFQGHATLDATKADIRLRYKVYSIPYEKIRHIGYYSFRHNQGILIKTGRIKRLELNYAKDSRSLDTFCTALKKKVK